MLNELWLATRSVTMTVLFPGTVAGYLPYRMLRPIVVPPLGEWSWQHYAATAAFMIGPMVLLICI